MFETGCSFCKDTCNNAALMMMYGKGEDYGVTGLRERDCCLMNVYESPSCDGLSLEIDGL